CARSATASVTAPYSAAPGQSSRSEGLARTAIPLFTAATVPPVHCSSARCRAGARVSRPASPPGPRQRRGDAGDLSFVFEKSGAGEGIRTLDPNLGKVVLYP